VVAKGNMLGSGDREIRFRTPPVIETLQGLFFRPLARFTSAHQGLLWAKYFRSEFPHLEEKACLEEVIEPFGDEIASSRAMGIRVSDKPESPRLWAKSKDDAKVLQIQRNAFITNWLRDNQKPAYVRYDDRKNEFAERLKAFLQFLEEEKIEECVPTSCMMTYVNHIEIDSLDMEPLRASEVFSFFKEGMENAWLPKPDQLAVNLSYPLPDQRGRLHLQVNPAVKKSKDSQKFVMRIDVTARGKPAEKTIEGALAWFELGHEWIVRGFKDITRPSWHLKWGLET
jgi:uncharacterized protein (TIGR04255 family)